MFFYILSRNLHGGVVFPTPYTHVEQQCSCVCVSAIYRPTNKRKNKELVLWVAAASPLFVSNSVLLCVEHTRACVVPVENDIAFITVPGGR